MATRNFYVENANATYVIKGLYEDEDGKEFVYDEIDWEDRCESIVDFAKNTFDNYFPSEGGDNDRNFYGKYVCESQTEHVFGTTNVWFMGIAVKTTIICRSGYYSGAVLDYEIMFEDAYGNNVLLSEGDVVSTMMGYLEELVDKYGHECKWNLGTFEIQRRNIKNWLTKLLDEKIDECETICKNNCDGVLRCVGTFSNGESVYEREIG